MFGVSRSQRPRLLDMRSWSSSLWPRRSSWQPRRSRLWDISEHSHALQPSALWAAGILGGLVGALIVGAFWYVQTQTSTTQQTPRQLGTSTQGQSPGRSHIQMSSHPARQ